MSSSRTTQPTPSAGREPRLGVDIGRVLIDGSSHPDGADTAFFQGDEPTMLATPEMAGAFDALHRLVPLFGGRVWLVSKCGPRVQGRTERWLAAHSFTERTGIPMENVRFCRERADKRVHCVHLGLTHFVDDRLDVHTAIHGVVDHHLLFGPKPRTLPDYVTAVDDWAAAEAVLVASLNPSEEPAAQ